MKKGLLLITFLLSYSLTKAQVNASDALKNSNYRYETDFLSKPFHAERRQAFRALMPANSVAIFFSNPLQTRSNDVEFDFHQDPDFYYLCGLTEPDAVFLLFKEPQQIDGTTCSEVLFLKERNISPELWTGRILGTVEAVSLLGIPCIYKNTEFLTKIISLEKFDHILAKRLVAVSDNKGKSGDLYELQLHFNELLEQAGTEKKAASELNEIMRTLREIKQAEEITLMKKAIGISCEAHIELMKSLHPSMTEYQAQSIVEYIFKSKGAESVAYPTIAGNNENSCVLHYSTNRKPDMKNKLLLVDAGAEYHGYAADVTRTLPVNGVFTTEERAIYDLVLEAQEAAIRECLAGNKLNAPHQAAVKVIKAGLLQLGIIQSESEYLTYFMHGTSHYLGLDVHDVGTRGDLKPGTIITAEPGIYIPEGSNCDKKWWNIGVRIEDDILITTGVPENLSGSVPRKASEIEALMKLKGFFEK